MVLLKTLALFCLLAVAAAGAFLFMAVEHSPTVPPAPELTVADLHALEILSADNDPRSLPPGESATLSLSENDLELALGYVLNRLHLGQADVVLGDADDAVVSVSARLPVDFTDLYLNLKASLHGGGTFPTVTGVTLGGIAVPDWLSAKLLDAARQLVGERYPEYQRLQATIENVSFDDDRLRLRYRWDPELARDISRKGGELLLSGPLQELVAVYRGRLRELAEEPNLPKRVSTSEFLRPLFVYAHNRGGDPVEENRALLLALALYVLDLDTMTLSEGEEAMPRHELRFYKRNDWARHFFISIGLTLGSDVGLADNIGVLKELEDTQGKGSGFSFTDIGADRVGARFAEFAVSGPENARLLQRRMAEEEGDEAYFPDLRDLPEFLSQEEFADAFGSTESQEFQRELDRIDARISALPVFAPAP
jgi:hypothetical protein